MKKNSMLYIRNSVHSWQKIGKLDEHSKVLSITEDRLNDDHFSIPSSVVKKGWFTAISLTINKGDDINVYSIPVDQLQQEKTIQIDGEDPNFIISKVDLQKYKV